MRYIEDPFWPARHLVFFLLSPLIIPLVILYCAVKKWRCRRDGGHDWRDDWGSDTPEWGTVIKEYDYCQSCPASRSRDLREVDD